MRIKQVGNKADSVLTVIRNAETSASIPAGSPVVLVMNGTNDGLDVVLPATAGSEQKMRAFRYGVSTKTLAAGDLGEAIIFGISNNLILLRQSRSSSTVSWATEAARSVGEYLSIDTLNNYFVTAASTVGQLSNSTATAATTPFLTLNPIAALGQTLASYAGSASSTADTRLYITAAVKAYVRMM